MSPTIPVSKTTAITRTSIVAKPLVIALAIFIAAAALSGCASIGSPDDGVTMAAPCQGASEAACEASDNARQLRDAAAYESEPELGYVKSPPGMLPMPTTSRNSPL
jgi:uncharacterized protein YceK